MLPFKVRNGHSSPAVSPCDAGPCCTCNATRGVGGLDGLCKVQRRAELNESTRGSTGTQPRRVVPFQAQPGGAAGAGRRSFAAEAPPQGAHCAANSCSCCAMNAGFANARMRRQSFSDAARSCEVCHSIPTTAASTSWQPHQRCWWRGTGGRPPEQHWTDAATTILLLNRRAHIHMAETQQSCDLFKAGL